jgi:hypothetical protein
MPFGKLCANPDHRRPDLLGVTVRAINDMAKRGVLC